MHEELMLAENLIAAVLVLIVVDYAWKIGTKIGFSRPWKQISIGFIFVSAGRILSFIDQLYINTETPALTDIAAVSLSVIIIGFLLVIFGLRSLYLFVKKEVK